MTDKEYRAALARLDDIDRRCEEIAAQLEEMEAGRHD